MAESQSLTSEKPSLLKYTSVMLKEPRMRRQLGMIFWRSGLVCQWRVIPITLLMKKTLKYRKRDFSGMPCSMGGDLSRGDDFCDFTFYVSFIKRDIWNQNQSVYFQT